MTSPHLLLVPMSGAHLQGQHHFLHAHPCPSQLNCAALWNQPWEPSPVLSGTSPSTTSTWPSAL